MNSFRARFPICRRRTYLNSCSQGALSEEVDAALGRFRESWNDEGSPWAAWVAELERLRALAARLLGADADEIAVMPNASVAIAAIATAVGFDRDRSEVLLDDLEFPTAAHVWLAQRRRGAHIRWVHADDEMPRSNAYARAISPRTRVVCATSVAFRTGYREDLASLVDLCRRSGAWLVVDDYQRTGTGPLDVHALGVDVLVTGSLKYLLGASGVAFLYVRRDLIASFEPLVTGWFGRVHPFDFRADVLDWAPDARRFETGSPPVPSIYAAAAGIELILSVGVSAVGSRIAALVTRTADALHARGYAMMTPADSERRGPLIVVRSADASELARRLHTYGIIVSARGEGVRCSFHAYNTEDDVDRLMEALRREEALIVRV